MISFSPPIGDIGEGAVRIVDEVDVIHIGGSRDIRDRTGVLLHVPDGPMVGDRDDLFDLSAEEVADQRHHFVGLVLQSEMAGVDEVKLDLGKVALIGIRAIGGEYLVVLAPDDQRGRPVLAEIGLDRRIERQVGAIVVEEIHLDFGVARPVEQGLVVDPIIRRDAAEIGDAVGVLELCRLRGDQHVQRLAVSLRVVGPIGLDRIPELFQPFVIGVAVLHDESR